MPSVRRPPYDWVVTWQEVETYDSLDGQRLVPYQCVVRTSAWEVAKPRFLEVFPLAKTAYRRCNGGSSAPGVHENVEPKYLTEELQLQEEEARALQDWHLN